MAVTSLKHHIWRNLFALFKFRISWTNRDLELSLELHFMHLLNINRFLFINAKIDWQLHCDDYGRIFVTLHWISLNEWNVMYVFWRLIILGLFLWWNQTLNYSLGNTQIFILFESITYQRYAIKMDCAYQKYQRIQPRNNFSWKVFLSFLAVHLCIYCKSTTRDVWLWRMAMWRSFCDKLMISTFIMKQMLKKRKLTNINCNKLRIHIELNQYHSTNAPCYETILQGQKIN